MYESILTDNKISSIEDTTININSTLFENNGPINTTNSSVTIPGYGSSNNNTKSNISTPTSLAEQIGTTSVFGSLKVKDSISSDGFVPGISGWRINGLGNVEFNNGKFRGDITGSTGSFTGSISAASGTIGGFTIGANELYNGNLHLNAIGENITLGSATAYGTGTGVYIGKSSGIYTFRAGNPAGSYFGWDGTNAVLSGNILSTSKVASDTYNFNAELVAPNSVTTKTMGFPIIFGDGRDGDVTITGTTNINSTKQYNNLTINNGGVLTSSTNKYIFLAVKGTLTIASGGKISMAGKGSAGGAGGTYGGTTSGATGTDGSGSGAGVDYIDFTTRAGASAGGGGCNNASTSSGSGGNGYSSGGNGYSRSSGVGGNGVSIPQLIKDRASMNQNILLNLWGAGGGGGNASGVGSVGGNGGNGGGVIYLECYELVINEATTALDASGIDGGNATGSAGGGGGGGGGCVFIRYHILTNTTANNSNIKAPGGDSGDGEGIYDGGIGGTGLVFLQQI